MNTWNKRSAVVLCVLLLCLMAGGCGKTGDSTELPETSRAQENTELPKEEATQPTSEITNDLVIVTDFGEFVYPEQWSEFIKTNQTKSDDQIRVLFLACINEKEYPLFNAVVGNGDGVKVGELTDAEGNKRPVYIEMIELEEDPSLTEGEQNRLYAMQEDLNYLIDHLK